MTVISVHSRNCLCLFLLLLVLLLSTRSADVFVVVRSHTGNGITGIGLTDPMRGGPEISAVSTCRGFEEFLHNTLDGEGGFAADLLNSRSFRLMWSSCVPSRQLIYIGELRIHVGAMKKKIGTQFLNGFRRV